MTQGTYLSWVLIVTVANRAVAKSVLVNSRQSKAYNTPKKGSTKNSLTKFCCLNISVHSSPQKALHRQRSSSIYLKYHVPRHETICSSGRTVLLQPLHKDPPQVSSAQLNAQLHLSLPQRYQARLRNFLGTLRRNSDIQERYRIWLVTQSQWISCRVTLAVPKSKLHIDASF